MGCCENIMKCILFTFNFIFVVIGLVLVVLGGVLLGSDSSYSDVITNIDMGLRAPQIVIIVLGCLIFFIAFLGCCGALQDNKCMLISFAVLVLIIFVGQLAVGIYAATHMTELEDMVGKGLINVYNQAVNEEGLRTAIDELQKSGHCCGPSGPNTLPAGLDRDSCCVDFSEGCAVAGHALWQTGCKEVLVDFSTIVGQVVGGVAIGLGVLEVFLVIFAFVVSARI